jgi:hypothetical protein
MSTCPAHANCLLTLSMVGLSVPKFSATIVRVCTSCQRLTLVHFSAQPEPVSSLKSPNVTSKKCSRQAESGRV